MPALAILMMLVTGDTARASAVAIMSSGTFHGDEVPADADGPWLALLPEPGGASLHPVHVSVAAVHDPHVDGEGEETGKRVDLSPADRD